MCDVPIEPGWLVGVDSGASTPEVSVQSVVAGLRELGVTGVREIEGVAESVELSPPLDVRPD